MRPRISGTAQGCRSLRTHRDPRLSPNGWVSPRPSFLSPLTPGRRWRAVQARHGPASAPSTSSPGVAERRMARRGRERLEPDGFERLLEEIANRLAQLEHAASDVPTGGCSLHAAVHLEPRVKGRGCPRSALASGTLAGGGCC